jgi:hypothetical protein
VHPRLAVEQTARWQQFHRLSVKFMSAEIGGRSRPHDAVDIWSVPKSALSTKSTHDRVRMADSKTHRWRFAARFRRNAFGWRSQPAIERVHEAVAEIRKAARRDPALAADVRCCSLRRRASTPPISRTPRHCLKSWAVEPRWRRPSAGSPPLPARSHLYST